MQHRFGQVVSVWAAATFVACAAVHQTFSLGSGAIPARSVVASVWSAGQLLARATLARVGDHDAQLDEALASRPGATLVYETIVGEAAVLVHPEAALALSFVPGRDGIALTVGDRTEYLTPDELLARQAYDKGVELPSLGFKAGVDVTLALAIFADRFGMTVPQLLERARIRRVRMVRSLATTPSPAHPITAASMTDKDVRGAVLAAARFLERGVDAQGHFRYLVDASTNATLGGYDWPRHAGATYFLAQAASLSHDSELEKAALRAAGYLRDRALVRCGSERCVGDARVVDVGSTALAVIAFVQIAQAQLDPSYAKLVAELAAFLRSQQRPDGEFMHEYDREERHPIDVQLLYYSGEAALALSRASSLLDSQSDLESATRALAHLVGTGWRFFGSRYYFGEEHWTCQAMDDLWARAPDLEALDFCLRWQTYNRQLQYTDGETPYDAEGAYGFGPIVTPRLTPVGSRCEAGIATLDAAVRQAAAGPSARLASPDELSALKLQMRRSLAVLLRHQFRPGPRHLFADPDAVEGAMPASEVDWQLRIDFAQHSGSAWIRWLDRHEVPAAD